MGLEYLESTGVALGTSLNVIYVSKLAGIHQNSNVSSGGGTDDTAIIQAALDRASTLGSVVVIQDGASLISTLAINYANTTLMCLEGCGFWQANNSNANMVTVNWGTASGTQTSPISNWAIIGGTYNQNRANQSKYEGGNSSNPWTRCFMVARANNGIIQGVTVLNSYNYAFHLTGGVNYFTIKDCVVTNPNVANTDGIHLGQASYGFIQNFNYTGGDDCLALNTDEDINPYPGDNRWPTSGGAIANMVFDTIYSSTPTFCPRFIGYVTSGGVTTISNVVFKNLRGTSGGISQGGVTLSNICFDGYYVLTGGIPIITCSSTGLVLDNCASGTIFNVAGSTGLVGNTIPAIGWTNTKPSFTPRGVSPIASSSYSTRSASNAFDGVTTGNDVGWVTNGTTTGYIGCKLPWAMVVNSYTVFPYQLLGTGNTYTRTPTAWTFQGSNDNSTWTTLDTRASQTTWTVGTGVTYTCANSTAYLYYRLNITANNGDSTYLGISELQFTSSTGLLLGLYSNVTIGCVDDGVHAFQVAGGLIADIVKMSGLIYPQQAPTASAPAYVLGGMYFDTTLNKLRIGGASGWETVTSV